MTTDVENTKILVVDSSPAMLEVLKIFSSKHGYDIDSHSDPADAVAALNGRFLQFNSDYRCVLLGWPQGDSAIVQELITSISSPDHQDLPVLVICQEITPQLSTLVKRRTKTRALLWKDYRHASEIIDRLPVVRVPRLQEKSSESTPQCTKKTGPVKSALLVDSAPSICHTLREIMQSNGYEVTVSNTAVAACQQLQNQPFDIVVTDYHLHGNGAESAIENFCHTATKSNSSAVVAVVSNKYTDAIIKHALTAGAATCLFKSESSELLFARVDALTKNLVARPASPAATEPAEQQASPAAVTVKSDKSKLTNEMSGDPCVGEEFKADRAVVQPVVLEPVEKIKDKMPAKISKPVASAPVTPSVTNAEPVDKVEFKKILARALGDVADKNNNNIRYSVLMLDVQLVAATGDRLSIGDSEPMRKIVQDCLVRLYKREKSISYLGDGQFAFIIATRKFQDALMLSQKVLQIIPRMIRYLNNMGLVSHAAVIQIDGTCTDPEEVLAQGRIACARARKDQRDNCALVMPMRKYLTGVPVATEA